MPGGSTQKTNTTQQQTQSSNQQGTQSGTTAPWEPTQGSLLGLLNQLSGISTSPNAAQTEGAQGLVDAAKRLPDFSSPVTTDVNSLLSGGGANGYGGILNSAYGNLTNSLTPFANGSMVGGNKALQKQLDVAGNDVTNNIKGQFAAAGRSFSPDEAQAIARGVTQAQAPIIANQYNADVANQLGAAGTLFNAGNSTFGGLLNANQTDLANRLSGIGAAGAVPGILNQNANALLQAGNTQAGLPFMGPGSLESLLLPIAGLGSQTNGSYNGNSSGTSFGTGNSTTTQQTDPTSNIIGGVLGGVGLLSKFLPMMSDEREKENIAQVGILNDGQKVYRYNFKRDAAKTPQIGLLAQEVERVRPEAVKTIGGRKHVDYGRATRMAA